MSNDSASVEVPQDPFNQTLTLLLEDGAPFKLTTQNLKEFNLYNVRICINYGSQIGATLLLIVVLALITPADKRRSPIFVVNILALISNFIRSLLQALYFTSGFSVPYAYFASDYSRVPSVDYANSVAANVFTLLVQICVSISLVMQIRVVCLTMKRIFQLLVIMGSGLVALVALAFRMALVVQNSRAVVRAESFMSFQWLASATNITATVSFCVFCVIFVVKLGVAMRERKKLGLRRYGPMRVLFIMGCQTLFIPAIFAILQYFTQAPELGTNVLTLVAIFLPLSSTWAAASINGQRRKIRDPESQGRIIGTHPSSSSGQQETKRLSNGSLHTPTYGSRHDGDDITMTEIRMQA